eukprot:5392676-Prymnesium_polylepis.1
MAQGPPSDELWCLDMEILAWQNLPIQGKRETCCCPKTAASQNLPSRVPAATGPPPRLLSSLVRLLSLTVDRSPLFHASGTAPR